MEIAAHRLVELSSYMVPQKGEDEESKFKRWIENSVFKVRKIVKVQIPSVHTFMEEKPVGFFLEWKRGGISSKSEASMMPETFRVRKDSQIWTASRFTPGKESNEVIFHFFYRRRRLRLFAKSSKITKLAALVYTGDAPILLKPTQDWVCMRTVGWKGLRFTAWTKWKWDDGICVNFRTGEI